MTPRGIIKKTAEALLGETPTWRESHAVDSRADDVVHPEKEWFRKILDGHYTTILEYLEPQLLLDEFKKSAFLTNSVIRDIEEERETSDKNREIVQKVKTGGEKGYNMFKECLVRSGQSFLCKFLHMVEKGEDMDLKTLHQGVEMERKARERKESHAVDSRAGDVLHPEKEWFRKILDRNYTSILEYLEPQLLLDEFKESAFFKNSVIRDIEEERKTSDKNREIVQKVKTGGEKGYNMFKECLVRSGQSSLCNFLDKVEKGEDVDLKTLHQGVEMERKARERKEKRKDNLVYEKVLDAMEETLTKVIKKETDFTRHEGDQGIIDDKDKNVFCDRHPDIPSSFYCSAHDTFCCEECAHNAHRACTGVRQSTADFMILKTLDLSPNRKREYRVRVDEQELCSTFRSCILPNGEILLADNCNNRLKKLDIYYNVIGHCVFTDPPFDICTVENGTVLISFGFYVQFVDVENDIEPKKKVELKNTCFQIAWHNGLLFYSDKSSIYKCDGDRNRQTLAYTMKNKNITCKRFVISNDGNKIFIATGKNGLLIVDIANETVEDINQTISINRELLDCTDVVNVNDKFMLACDFKSQAVWLISSGDGKIIRKIVEKSSGLHVPWSISFDNADCTVVVGRLGKDFISVFQVKLNDA